MAKKKKKHTRKCESGGKNNPSADQDSSSSGLCVLLLLHHKSRLAAETEVLSAASQECFVLPQATVTEENREQNVQRHRISVPLDLENQLMCIILQADRYCHVTE